MGDGVARGRGVCVPGGTKALSASTRCKDWRPAVGKLAFLRQESGRMDGEAWAGRVRFLSDAISVEVEIQIGCAVTVSRLPAPYFAPESPGPDSEVRGWIGWTPLEKTVGSGVWLFRGAWEGDRTFSALSAAGDRVEKGSYHTPWAVSPLSSCSFSNSYGQGTAVGRPTGERCWPLLSGLWRSIARLMKSWLVC